MKICGRWALTDGDEARARINSHAAARRRDPEGCKGGIDPEEKSEKACETAHCGLTTLPAAREMRSSLRSREPFIPHCADDRWSLCGARRAASRPRGPSLHAQKYRACRGIQGGLMAQETRFAR